VALVFSYFRRLYILINPNLVNVSSHQRPQSMDSSFLFGFASLLLYPATRSIDGGNSYVAYSILNRFFIYSIEGARH